MACAITITSVVGVGPLPSIVRVTGTATDCASVVVRLECTPGAGLSLTVPVDPAGNWLAEFANPADAGCSCGELWHVEAFCATDPMCKAERRDPVLKCVPDGGPDGDCPVASAVVTIGGCNPDGTRTVSIATTIAFGGLVVSQWNFGDGTLAPASTELSYTVTHNYNPAGSPYTATLTFVLPDGCPVFTTTIGPLNPCDGKCPEVVGLTVTEPGCAGSGASTTVTVTGALSPPISGCTFQWDFGDGTPDVVTATPTATHVYTVPGLHAIAVVAECGPCTKLSTIWVHVPPCCPEVTGLSASVEGCADSVLESANVTLVATVDPPAAPGNFVWTFGDSSPATMTTIPTVTHNYEDPGTKTVEVTYTPSEQGCPPTVATATVSIPACDGETPDGETPDGWGWLWCTGLRYAIVIFTILGALALYIALCVPAAAPYWGWVALGFALAAAALAIIWGIFCPKPCGYGLLLGWQVALGAGIGALYFAPCCPSLWVIGSGLIASAIGLILAWRNRCHVSWCDFIAELAVVLGSVILPVLSYLAGIPVIQACLSLAVTQFVATLAAAVTLNLAICKAS